MASVGNSWGGMLRRWSRRGVKAALCGINEGLKQQMTGGGWTSDWRVKLQNPTAPPSPSSFLCRLLPGPRALTKAAERAGGGWRGAPPSIPMLVNMWDAFCPLVFACGGCSHLFVSGGCCEAVCMCGVASVHAACPQVDVIKATAPYFPSGFILSAEGRRFLMVFHLNTVGLVPAAAPATSLLLSLPPSSSPTWGLEAQSASARCV